MFDRARRVYLKARHLPRRIVAVLDGLAAGVARLEQHQDVIDQAGREAVREVRDALGSLREATAHSAGELLVRLDTITAQVAAVEQHRAAMEAELRDVRAEVSRLPGLPDDMAILQSVRDEIVAVRRDAAQHAEQASAAPPAATRDDAARLIERIDWQTGLIDRQTARIEHLGMVVAEQARIFPSWVWTPESAARVRDILAMLTPMVVPDVGKVRVGRDWDGGYVMLEDFGGIAAALSLGIADDVSWDIQIARRGIQVLQFDPTVAASPAAHELFRFAALRVAAEDGDGAVSLNSIVWTRVDDGDAPLLLKIDIEGDEWPVFAAASEQVLGRFKQIVCEFHTLDRLAEEEFGNTARAVFGKLAQTHFVHHVHGNNCSSFVNIGNVIVPQTLEVSFALRSAYAHADGVCSFPTALDQPNQPGRADLFLGSFRF